MDKLDICDLAQRIGTFDLSAGIQEYCQLVPDKPVTACRPEAASREEQDFDFAVLDQAIQGRRTLMLKDLSPADLVMPYLYTSELKDGAVVIDCRGDEAYDGWHYPKALHCELHELLTDFKRLDKQRSYVLYCPH
jgi:thiamine biosynthesis protein ThiI